MLRAAGVRPALVTTAPVGQPTEFLPRAKIFIKRLLGRSTWLDSIVQYNDWRKQYAWRERIPVFDLGAELRRNENERWLRIEYDIGDWVHLTQASYDVVDRAFEKFLLDWTGGLI